MMDVGDAEVVCAEHQMLKKDELHDFPEETHPGKSRPWLLLIWTDPHQSSILATSLMMSWLVQTHHTHRALSTQ